MCNINGVEEFHVVICSSFFANMSPVYNCIFRILRFLSGLIILNLLFYLTLLTAMRFYGTGITVRRYCLAIQTNNLHIGIEHQSPLRVVNP